MYLYYMKKLLRNLDYYFDYYIGYFLYSSGGGDHIRWSNYMINKYPEKYPNEIEYLKQKKSKVD